VPVFFSACDVCVLPYTSATQSGITSIAYHFDLPLIATDVGGLKESIIHDETGLIVQQCNPEYIATSIRSYFDFQMAGRFITGIQKIKVNLSWERFAKDIITFTTQL
jgi:glycosyltransferase involved in cell wall biosynthesis